MTQEVDSTYWNIFNICKPSFQIAGFKTFEYYSIQVSFTTFSFCQLDNVDSGGVSLDLRMICIMMTPTGIMMTHGWWRCLLWCRWQSVSICSDVDDKSRKNSQCTVGWSYHHKGWRKNIKIGRLDHFAHCQRPSSIWSWSPLALMPQSMMNIALPSKPFKLENWSLQHCINIFIPKLWLSVVD